MPDGLPDFGTFERDHQERPGPIETLVEGWVKADVAATFSLAPEMLARRIDQAIVTAADSIRQLREDEDRFEDSLRKVVVVTTVGGLRDLDEMAEFFEAAAGFSLSSMADNSWNLRSGMVPFKVGDPLWIGRDCDCRGEHADDCSEKGKVDV